MPPFEFVAYRGERQIRGRVVAPDLVSARRHLVETYDRVLTVDPVTEEKAEFLPLPWRRVGVAVLATYTRQFATLLNAGVSIHRSLMVLERGDSERLNRVLATVRKEVMGGMPLSAALARQGHIFPGDYVSLVRAGETGGLLVDTLTRLAEGLEKAAEVRQKLLSALTYPAAVMVLAAGVMWLFLYWVMPALTPIFDNLGVQMPLITRLVMGVAGLVQNPVVIVLGLVLALVGGSFGWNFFVKTPEGRQVFWTQAYRLPLVGEAMRKLAMSRFLYALAAMLGSGVRFEQALQAVEGVSSDPELHLAIFRVRQRIRIGMRLVDAMDLEAVFPRLVVQMVLAGESSGRLAEMMLRTARSYDLEVDLFIANLLSLMEPLVLVIMGAVAGVVLLAAFMPILQLMTAF